MIKENKVSKYFLYAIGEIILVVIGILIALQINTNNEQKKLNATTKVYLQNLNAEISNNTNELNTNISIIDKSIKESINFLNTVNGESAQSLDNSSIDMLISNSIDPLSIQELNKTVFDDFINAGILENIDNQDLKQNILNIEVEFKNYVYRLNSARSTWEDYLMPYQIKNHNIGIALDSIRSNKFKRKKFNINRNAYLNNLELTNQMMAKLILYRNLARRMEVFVAFLNDLSPKIKEGIKFYD